MPEVISDVITIIFQERIRQIQIILSEIVSKSVSDSPDLLGPLAVVIQDDPAYLVRTVAVFHVVGFRRWLKVPYLVVHNVVGNRQKRWVEGSNFRVILCIRFQFVTHIIL